MPATLIRRYKRFLADVRFADGREETVHCPNPGSMLGLAEPGMTVYLSRAKNKDAKLPWGWRLVDVGSSLVCIDTMMANKLFAEAFYNGILTEFAQFDLLKAEHKFEDSRFDFLLSCSEGKGKDARLKTMVEVKSTTLVEDEKAAKGSKIAAFPDARTERGLKHLKTLSGALAGDKDMCCAQFYVVARADSVGFKAADWIDPAYAEGLKLAKAQGVQVFCRALEFDLRGRSADIFEVEMKLAGALPLI